MSTTPKQTAKITLDAWESLMAGHRSLSKIVDSKHEIWNKLSMKEYDVLYTLSKNTSPIRICDLADGVLLSQPALSRMVDRLVKKKLVEKVPDSEDKRASKILLTDEGSKLQKDIGWSYSRVILKELNTRLTEQDQNDLLRICSLLKTPKAPLK